MHGGRAGPRGPHVPTPPACPPARTETASVSLRKFIVPELKLLTVIRQGVHEAGLVRFRDVCVCPKYKRGRLTRGIAFGVLCLCRSPSRLTRVALLLQVLVVSYRWSSQPVVGVGVTSVKIYPRRAGRRAGGRRETPKQSGLVTAKACNRNLPPPGREAAGALDTVGGAWTSLGGARAAPTERNTSGSWGRGQSEVTSLYSTHTAEDAADFLFLSLVMFFFYFLSF